MITFKISPKNPEIFDFELMNTIQSAIKALLIKKNFLTGFMIGNSSGVSGDGTFFSFKGICISRENERELQAYFFNVFNEFLIKAGVSGTVYISGTSFSEVAGDAVFTLNHAFQPITVNQTLIGNLIPENEIPAEFKCAISDQLMDSPITTKGDATKKHYNKAHLKHHLFTKSVDAQLDPFTRQPIKPNTDLVKDEPLKKKIHEFVTSKIAEKATERLAKLNSVEAKYFRDRKISKEILQAILRECSAKNDLEATDVLISHFKLDVNEKDDNPGSGKTALHHAIGAKHVEMAKLLITKGAKTDIKDAFGKSQSVYALESGEPELIAAVMGNVDLAKVHNATINAIKKM